MQPELMNANINSLKAAHRSINGNITSAWQKKGDIITMSIEVPVNTTAIICLPPTSTNNIAFNGKTLVAATVKPKWIDRRERNTVVVGSGKYVLSYKKSALSGF